MADDESDDIPAPPPSRGPRVVTGDMLRQAGSPRAGAGATPTGWAPAPPPTDDAAAAGGAVDDAPTETLVGPAAAPTPYEPRGPRVVTGRTAPPPAVADPPGGTGTATAPRPRVVTGRTAPPPPVADPPGSTGTAAAPRFRVVTGRPAPPPPVAGPPDAAVSAADDDDTDPGWAPPGPATATIPPPLHRSAGPPPPPSSGPTVAPPIAPSTPGKASKRARSGGTREPLARVAFILALLSIPLTAVLAIPALLVARRAKRRIASRPGASGAGLVTVARLVAVVSLAAWLAVAGVVIANVVRPDGVDYAKLKPGDCIDTPEGTEVRRLKVRSCDKPHDAEVFAVVTHPAAPGDAFPGADALLEYAANACLGQPFTDYIGIPRGQSQLTEFEIVPESEAWSEGRRGLVCAVDNADRSPMTATVKGSAR